PSAHPPFPSYLPFILLPNSSFAFLPASLFLVFILLPSILLSVLLPLSTFFPPPSATSFQRKNRDKITKRKRRENGKKREKMREKEERKRGSKE
ncbi:hypothetical protein, partial [Brachyspira hyodysenteriae]|uniref:hypothetical protein n=1 Tax=Brachyspira hyodysenteriae TaxID=159 RepID=UPI001A7E13F8